MRLLKKRKNQTFRIILITILVLNCLVRLPGLFDPVSYGDECIYLTLGQAFLKGSVFYRDIHDNKPPLLYLVAALAGGNQFYFRLITIIWNTINIYLVYKLVKKLLKKETAGLVAAFLFAWFSLLPEGRAANGEIFMIMPATLGILLALKALEKKKKIDWFLSGLCFSIAFLFKIPIAFDFIGFVLAFFIFNISIKSVSRRNRKKNIFLFLKNIFIFLKDKRFYLTLIGFVAPILLSIVYYSSKGAFTPYVRSALGQNIGYLSSWGGSNYGLYIRMAILLIVTGLLYKSRHKLGFSFYLPTLMAFWGLYGVFLSERPYPHYYMEITAWAAVGLTVLIFQKKKMQIIFAVLFFLLAWGGYKYYNYWWYPHLPYYKNFINFVLKRTDRQEYFSYFGDKVLNDYKVARFVKKYTEADEPVFIWGDGVCIYALSRRLPPGRYTVNYHIFDFNGFEETIKAIEEKKPHIIIKLSSEKRNFPQLDKLLYTNYIKTQMIGEAKIYRQIFNY